MTTTPHPLGERFPRLVNPDLSGELNTFYNTLGDALREYETAIAKAGKVDPDLLPAKRAERQHKIVNEARRKLDRALNVEIQTLNVSRENIRQEIETAARPKKPETEIGQLLAFLRESELRGELKKMDTATRAKLLRESAARGDRSILTALENSLTSIAAPMLLDAARESYAEAVAQEPTQRLQIVEHVADSARETARRAGYEADKLLTNAKEILPKPLTMTSEIPVKNLSDAQKADLVSQVGFSGFKEIVAGSRKLPLEFALNDSQKTELRDLAGDTAYGEIMAGTRELPEKFAPAAAE